MGQTNFRETCWAGVSTSTPPACLRPPADPFSYIYIPDNQLVPPWKHSSLVYMIKYIPLWSLMSFLGGKKKNLLKKWQSMTLSQFAFSCQVSYCWSGRKPSISKDLEPIFPSGKERKPQLTRHLHVQARNEQVHAFKAILEGWTKLIKDSPFSSNFQRSNQVTL